MEERKNLGFSQEAISNIAKQANVPGATRQSQARYEKNLQSPSSAYMSAIAAAGADVQYILTGVRSSQVEPNRREDAVLGLFRGLTAKGQDEIIAALEEKKLLNELQAQIKKAGNG